jgi:rhamnosyltransferase
MEEYITVIVLYKCLLKESETFRSLLASAINHRQLLDVIIYDNSPLPMPMEVYDFAYLNITYISDPDNGGVSAAYNAAARIGGDRSKKWLILFDQDTALPVDILKQYCSSVSSNSYYQLFAPIMVSSHDRVISPCRFILNKGFSTNNRTVGVRSLAMHSLINCGLCISLEAFNNLKGFDEEFKLDYSDHDFINRFKIFVDTNVFLINAVVKHNLSVFEKNSLLSDKARFIYYNHAVLRYSQLYGGKLFSAINLILRCMKLSLSHRSLQFVRILKFI